MHGFDLLDCRMIRAPMRKVATNARLDGAVVVQNVRAGKGKGSGFDSATESYEDLVKSGVIDPTKVVRTALQNAASVAILLLTEEALVSDLPEKEKESAGAGHGHAHGPTRSPARRSRTEGRPVAIRTALGRSLRARRARASRRSRTRSSG